MKKSSVVFLPDRFREAMSAAGKTPAGLASAVGVSVSSIRRYMNGAPISVPRVRADICYVLKVNVHWLTGRSDSMERTPAQKYMDSLRNSSHALATDPQVYEIALALLGASEQELEKVAQALGTPTHLEQVAEKKS